MSSAVERTPLCMLLQRRSFAGPAVPNANGVSLDGGLAAEGADVSGVLGDFHLLDLLSEGGTVSVQRKLLALRCRM